ncbi:FkbM family methyltransferase [Actinoalloteichus caeruleus]|uniref:FkbM family methyltransferase n=1 Tax=Actinoalloteichus cyanogriseus TaxID=2893586 RepID=UPI0009DE8D1F|nr:FkbM family methyltransferase [Actinoalloteichus caeruleus]
MSELPANGKNPAGASPSASPVPADQPTTDDESAAWFDHSTAPNGEPAADRAHRGPAGTPPNAFGALRRTLPPRPPADQQGGDPRQEQRTSSLFTPAMPVDGPPMPPPPGTVPGPGLPAPPGPAPQQAPPARAAGRPPGPAPAGPPSRPPTPVEPPPDAVTSPLPKRGARRPEPPLATGTAPTEPLPAFPPTPVVPPPSREEHAPPAPRNTEPRPGPGGATPATPGAQPTARPAAPPAVPGPPPAASAAPPAATTDAAAPTNAPPAAPPAAPTNATAAPATPPHTGAVPPTPPPPAAPRPSATAPHQAEPAPPPAPREGTTGNGQGRDAQPAQPSAGAAAGPVPTEDTRPPEPEQVSSEPEPRTEMLRRWPPADVDSLDDSQDDSTEDSLELAEQPADRPRDTPRRPVTVCTVALPGERAAASVLRDSLRDHHPEARFVTLTISTAPPETGDDPVLTPTDIGLGVEEFHRLATSCDPEQLRAVLRPRLLAHLVRGGEPVLCLDPWVLVVGPVLDAVAEAVAERPVVLVPRTLDPVPSDGLRPTPAEFASAGTFDPGLVAVGPGAERFLTDWAAQLRAVPGASSALDAAPGLVEHRVLRDRGIGLSVWNADRRPLGRDIDGRVTVDGRPLRTIHFGGFDPHRPWLLSTVFGDRPRVLLSEHPELAALCATYRARLVRAADPAEAHLGFREVPDGSGLEIPPHLRQQFHECWRRALATGGEAPPPAFGAPSGGVAAATAFLRWAAQPPEPDDRTGRRDTSGVSRWTWAVWLADRRLQVDFPDPCGTDRAAYRDWCAGPGVAAGRIHPEVLPASGAGASPTLLDQLGVCVLGAGELADRVRLAVEHSGLPTADEPLYPVVLACGPDAPVPSDRSVIRISADGAPFAPGVSELWVLSEASRRLAARGTNRPVRTVVLPVADRGEIDETARAAARARWGIPEGTVFCSSADHADERRTNPLGVVAAFLAAFPDRRDVRLVLRVSGAADFPESAERLRLATANDPRVLLFAAADLTADDLVDIADCVVSLHRGGGDGAGDAVAAWLLGVAARGVPVVCTDQGATTEQLGRQSAAFVPCLDGGAEPDGRSAADLLRHLADSPEVRVELGQAGRSDVTARYGAHPTGEAVRGMVEQTYRAWRAGRAQAPVVAEDPLRALVVARHALLRPVDVGGTTSKVPIAPALRKAVLRVLHHYDTHMREMLTALVDGVERTARDLVARQDDADRDTNAVDVEALRAELATVVGRQGDLAEHLVGADDAVVRARADLAAQQQRLRVVEEAVTTDSERRDRQVELLAERLDGLAGVLDRTLDRIDAVEARLTEAMRDRDGRLESRMRHVDHAVRTSDALRRVVVREHQRQHPAPVEGATSMVLCDAGLFRLPAHDGVMLPWLSSHGVWEPDVSTALDGLLEPDGVFLDVGAHVGYQTTRVLSRLGANGRVVAVEPCPEAGALLRHNVELNIVPENAGRLTVVEAAAWDQATRLVAEPDPGGGLRVRSGADGVPTTSPGDPERDENGFPAEGPASTSDGTGTTAPGAVPVPETVRGVRLDEELVGLQAFEHGRLSVVRVDTPGSTWRALRGLSRLLRRDHPSVVCSMSVVDGSELGDDPAAALDEMRSWGYELARLDGGPALEPAEVLRWGREAGGRVRLLLRPRETRAPGV